jgi:ElaA protein
MFIWQIATFNELTNLQLYKILQLRNAIFVVEQDCIYQDADDKDEVSKHICCWHQNELAAYCRILPAGLSYDNSPSIGRVMVNQHFRRTGLGVQLMQKAIKYTIKNYSTTTITISAQLYLLQFYTSLGFIPIGEEYLEDNIPHIEMVYTT